MGAFPHHAVGSDIAQNKRALIVTIPAQWRRPAIGATASSCPVAEKLNDMGNEFRKKAHALGAEWAVWPPSIEAE